MWYMPLRCTLGNLETRTIDMNIWIGNCQYPEQVNTLNYYIINRQKMQGIVTLCQELSYLYAKG